jgi:hypothetical protein
VNTREELIAVVEQYILYACTWLPFEEVPDKYMSAMVRERGIKRPRRTATITLPRPVDHEQDQGDDACTRMYLTVDATKKWAKEEDMSGLIVRS